MRKTIVFLAVAALVVVSAGLAQAAPIISIFKSGADINMSYTTNLFTDFKTAGAANVVQVTMDMCEMSANGAALRNPNNVGPAAVAGTGDTAQLFKWDLSSIPAGATISKAQIRLYATNGNTDPEYIAPVVTHNWTQGVATMAGPNNPATGLTWGPASNAQFGAADLGTPTKVTGSGATQPLATGKPSIFDVTADLQAMVNGTMSNYGWAVGGNATYTGTVGNRAWYTNRNSDTTTRPALFVAYTPEPVSLALLALGGLALLRRRA